MTLESLDKLNDEELMQVRARAYELIKQHDAERKAKAIADARALKEKWEAETRAVLATVGLPLKTVMPKKRRTPAKRGDNATAQAPATNTARKTG